MKVIPTFEAVHTQSTTHCMKASIHHSGKLFFMISLLFIAVSCNNFRNHISSTPLSPSFSRKGELLANAYIDNRHAEGQAAVSLTKNMGISGAYSTVFSGKGRVMEGGAVLYAPVKKNPFVFYELCLGAGKGKFSGSYRGGKEWYNNPRFDERINFENNFSYAYLQPALYYKWENGTSLGLIQKFSFIRFHSFYEDYSKVAYPNPYNESAETDTLRFSNQSGTREDVLVELKLKYFEYGYFIFQTAYSLDNFKFSSALDKNSRLRYQPFAINFGFQLRISNRNKN